MKEHWWQKYEHVKYECGGVIGMYNRKNFTCDRCGKSLYPSDVHFDMIMVNDKTGWVFPMIEKEKKED